MTGHSDLHGAPGYWPSPWPAEDGGPRRTQHPQLGPGLGGRDAPPERPGILPAGNPGSGDPWNHAGLEVTSRDAAVATMVVLRDPGQAYLLRHTGGDDAISWVEQIDPESLEVTARSPDLAGGPTWPGGLAAHANGSLYVTFGNHVHRLAADTSVTASRTLPRRRPYNSFVVLPDGHLATKDFGGTLPGGVEPSPEPAELLILEPEGLEIVARLELPERSIARLSADGDDLYVVGDSSLLRARWDGRALTFDVAFQPRYRTMEGQTYGWDAVIDAGAAWFLDNGAGSERYAGTFRGHGISPAPLHLVRVDLSSGAVTLAEICGEPNGVVANPPVVDPERRIAVGYDSGNGVMTAFSFTDNGVLEPRWTRPQNHASHMIRFPATGELVTADYDVERMADQVVVLDIETGTELARADTGSPLQSVVFPSAGFDRDVYLCSFTTLTRVCVRA